MFDPMEKAHIAMGLALACARIHPEADIVVPCLTEEVAEAINEALEVMSVEVEEAYRLHVVLAH